MLPCPFMQNNISEKNFRGKTAKFTTVETVLKFRKVS